MLTIKSLIFKWNNYFNIEMLTPDNRQILLNMNTIDNITSLDHVLAGYSGAVDCQQGYVRAPNPVYDEQVT
jgi:hypothetical protein